MQRLWGHCALLGAAIIPAVGIIAVPFGAGVEMVMGSIGYFIGSLAANPSPAPHTIVVR